MSPALIPEQRRENILRLLRQENVLSFHQLAEALGVSHMTVRRDVALLASHGRVQATQGGAAAMTRLLAEPSRAEKELVQRAEKIAIAREAALMVSDGMTIYLDAGTTVQAMRPFLEDRVELTIVSNDLSTIYSFLNHPGVAEIICVGGLVDRANESVIGRFASWVLAEITLDIAFLSCSSWNSKGSTTPIEAKIEPKRQALESALETTLLADSSKYGTHSRFRTVSLTELDSVITDSGLDEAAAVDIESRGTRVIRAANEPG